MISIIDYGAGNLRSVANAVTKIGYQAEITRDAGTIQHSAAVIFPGVGAAGDTMTSLNTLGLSNVIRGLVTRAVPLLAICIGLQVLFTGTEEGGWYECLNIVPGRVKRLPPGLKIPHMGWNQVRQKSPHPIFKGIPDGTNFYFVHSYYADPEDKSVVIAETDYGIAFSSAIATGNLVATQFHPERSGDIGLQVYRNFFEWAGV